MAESYEFGISGRIGPLIRSCLPGLELATEDEAATVLSGTASCPTDLHRVLDLLNTHGLPAADIRLSYRDEDAPPAL